MSAASPSATHVTSLEEVGTAESAGVDTMALSYRQLTADEVLALADSVARRGREAAAVTKARIPFDVNKDPGAGPMAGVLKLPLKAPLGAKYGQSAHDRT